MLTRSFTFLFAPLLVALGAGVTLWWVEQRPNIDTEYVEKPGNEASREDKPQNDDMITGNVNATSMEQTSENTASEERGISDAEERLPKATEPPQPSTSETRSPSAGPKS